MKNKDIIKIINEEISDFDFLGNDQYMKDKEFLGMLKNEEFQKQFICDSLLKMRERIKAETTDNSINDDGSTMNLEINQDITYLYDQTKEPVKLSLGFLGTQVNIDIDSDYDAGRWGGSTDDAVAPSGGDWIDYVDWNNIDCRLYTIDGDEIDFIAFKKAPIRIQNLFIREYCQSGIEKGSDYSIKEKRPDNVRNIPYC